MAPDFTTDMVNFLSINLLIILARIILSGVLENKKEIVTTVCDLLLTIVVYFFTFRQREFIADNFGIQIYFVWLLLVGLLVLNVKDIYLLIKANKTKAKKQEF